MSLLAWVVSYVRGSAFALAEGERELKITAHSRLLKLLPLASPLAWRFQQRMWQPCQQDERLQATDVAVSLSRTLALTLSHLSAGVAHVQRHVLVPRPHPRQVSMQGESC